jgi:hypothetical protein
MPAPASSRSAAETIGSAVDVVVLFESALPLAQPLSTRLRDRHGFGGAALVEAALGLAQPAAPPLHRRQFGRQLIVAAVAEALVLGLVDRVRLRQDFARDLVVVEVLVLRGVCVQLRAVHRQYRHTHQAGVRAERKHVAEQAGERCLVALAKARDRAVIGALVRCDYADRDIVAAPPLDRPRRAPPGRVRLEQ